MNTLLKSEPFDAWLSGIKDKLAKAMIVRRLERAQAGNFGGCEPVGAGYRVYFTQRGESF